MTTSHNDSVRTALLRGIRIEARNAKVYQSFSQLFQGYDQDIVSIFREMAEEEIKHGTVLEERYRERFGPVPTNPEEPKEVIEAPDMDDSEAMIFDTMTLEQALEAGLKAEHMARNFYANEVDRTIDPDLKTLYRELSAFEEDHVRWLDDRLAKLRAGDPPSR